MQLRVTHVSRYNYQPAVETSHHLACLLPVDTRCQKVLATRLHIEPPPPQISERADVYGNRRSWFSLNQSHATLTVTAESTVETRAPPSCDSQMTWEAVRELLRYRVGADWDPESEFCFASPHIPRHQDFVTYAQPSLSPQRPLRTAAIELMQRIHRDCRYMSASTDISTPAVEALARRRGVCQDFAHILIACLRAWGLAARYVSGYLLTEPPPGQPRLTGADASHAWAQVYLPDLPGADDGAGWYDLDPTNNRHGWGTPGEDYVTLAIGRDYADISPIRGVIHGGARHTLSVAVTVAPVDEQAPEVLAADAAAETDRAQTALTSIPEDMT